MQTAFVYFDGERLPGRKRKLYTSDLMATKGTMRRQGRDWGPSGVVVAFQGEQVLETFCKAPGQYDWLDGASCVAECLLTGKPRLITPEHGGTCLKS